MHNNVYEFVCDELKEMDDKARKGELTVKDIEYADMLEHYKKSKLTADAMENSGYSGYSGASYDQGYGDYSGEYSGARGRPNAPRDSMGRFSGASYADRNLADELRRRASMERDDRARREMHSMADRIEGVMR